MFVHVECWELLDTQKPSSASIPLRRYCRRDTQGWITGHRQHWSPDFVTWRQSAKSFLPPLATVACALPHPLSENQMLAVATGPCGLVHSTAKIRGVLKLTLLWFMRGDLQYSWLPPFAEAHVCTKMRIATPAARLWAQQRRRGDYYHLHRQVVLSENRYVRSLLCGSPPLMHTQRDQRLQNLEAYHVPKEAQVAPENSGRRTASTRGVGEQSGSRPKRKRTETEAVEDLIQPQYCESGANRTKSASCDKPATSCIDIDRDDRHPIEHWASTGSWPENFSNMSQEQSDSSKKRGRGSSYTQSTKDGEVPKAHTRAFEGHLARHGILMEEQKGRLFLSGASKVLCEDFLLVRYEEPPYTQFPLVKFLEVCDRLRTRNEYRVFRDITPLLVPSAELLFVCGHDDLEHIAEEVSTDWTKSDPMGGPKPRPDFAAGIASSAFTEEEISKLKNHTAWQRATLFTDNMYFPFLLSEAKCGDQGINRADRQNAQSSSMAVNAIIQLYRVLGDDQASRLSRQILVFSVSHDNERVKIYGHYAVVEGAKTTYYRYPIESFTLNFHEGQGRRRTHDFVREIYHKFYPRHLKRIRSALAEMDDLRAQSIPSSMSVEESESQDVGPSAPSSQETLGFKKPNAPACKKQKGEMALLREQLAQQERQNKEQMAQLERLYKEQVAQQEKQYKEQMAQQKEQVAQQEKQYKEQMAQQEKQLAQQSEMLKQLLDRRWVLKCPRRSYLDNNSRGGCIPRYRFTSIDYAHTHLGGGLGRLASGWAI